MTCPETKKSEKKPNCAQSIHCCKSDSRSNLCEFKVIWVKPPNGSLSPSQLNVHQCVVGVVRGHSAASPKAATEAWKPLSEAPAHSSPWLLAFALLDMHLGLSQLGDANPECIQHNGNLIMARSCSDAGLLGLFWCQLDVRLLEIYCMKEHWGWFLKTNFAQERIENCKWARVTERTADQGDSSWGQ